MLLKIIGLLLVGLTLFDRICQGSNDTDVIQSSCKSAKSSGVYQLKLCQNCQSASSSVYCEMDSFDGGWIVIQQRLDGSEEFDRNWTEYRNGFGTVGEASEFWLGLDQIYSITNGGGEYELAIELKDQKGQYGYARYDGFRIAGEMDKYRMVELGEYNGTIKDSLKENIGCRFSTYDQDNDNHDDMRCSNHVFSYTGWWYNRCGRSALNGSFKRNDFGIGIYWDGFIRDGAYSRMMIRQKRTPQFD